MASTTNTLQNHDADIESAASYMSQYGTGEVSLIDTHWSEGIAIIQINNVEKRNAISGKMMVDFRNCVAKLESWNEGKAVILCGNGANFCSGGDLDFARKCSSPKDGLYLSILMQDVLRRLEKLPLISVALIHGPTLGGGAEIAVACDYMVAYKDATVGFVHGRMGITTAWGATARLIQSIGKKKALEVLLTSKIMGAEECLNNGLVSEIIYSENKLDACLEWMKVRLQHHYTITRGFKQAVIAHHSQSSWEELLTNETNLLLPLWGSLANRNALSKNIKHIKSKK